MNRKALLAPLAVLALVACEEATTSPTPAIDPGRPSLDHAGPGVNIAGIQLTAPSGGGNGVARVIWHPVGGISVYHIQVQPVGTGASYNNNSVTGIPTSEYGTVEHLYHDVSLPAGSYFARVRAGSGGFENSATFTLAEDGPQNNPPMAGFTYSPSSPTEGGTVTFSATASDPDGDALTYLWDFGDGSATSTEEDPSHVFVQDGSYEVKLTVNDGTDEITVMQTIVVANVLPVVSVPGGSIAEGGTFTGTGSFTDPGADAWSATVDYGDGSGSQPLPLNADKTFALSHTYGDDGDYTVTVTVSDDDGSSIGTATVSVSNVAPTITGFTVSPTAHEFYGQPVVSSVALSFTDPAGALDAPYMVAIDCGNGTSTSTQSGGEDVSGSCTYTDVGSYTVSATVTDKDGGVSAAATATVSVTYDFTGFFRPIDNPPVMNSAKAGSSIPVKFSLGGNLGLNVIASGFPIAERISCANGTVEADVEETVTAGGSTLTYDPVADQYVYVWKTEKEWAAQCRRLVVKLRDGTEHYADFNFKR